MEIDCPACSARYRVDAAEIPASGRTLRCSECGAEWAFRPQPPQSEVARPAPDPQRERAAAPLAVPLSAPAQRRFDFREIRDTEKEGRGGAFMTGFVLMLLLLAAGAALYFGHDLAAETLPGFAPEIARYVDAVDAARDLLDGWVETGLSKLRDLTGPAAE